MVDSQRNEQTYDKNKYIKYDPEWKCGCIGAHYTLSDFSVYLDIFIILGKIHIHLDLIVVSLEIYLTGVSAHIYKNICFKTMLSQYLFVMGEDWK